MEKELTLSEALKGTPSESFVKMVKLELQEIKQKFFSIGFRLYEAQAFKYYESLGYKVLGVNLEGNVNLNSLINLTNSNFLASLAPKTNTNTINGADIIVP